MIEEIQSDVRVECEKLGEVKKVSLVEVGIFYRKFIILFTNDRRTIQMVLLLFALKRSRLPMHVSRYVDLPLTALRVGDA